MRLTGTGCCPGSMLIQDAGGAKSASVKDQRNRTLSLAAALDHKNKTTNVGLPGQPSIGSVYHHMGFCRPCDFVYRHGGCRSGADCQFCHFCAPDERKKNKKTRAKVRKAMQSGSECIE